jgi:hypothetical protein
MLELFTILLAWRSTNGMLCIKIDLYDRVVHYFILMGVLLAIPSLALSLLVRFNGNVSGPGKLFDISVKSIGLLALLKFLLAYLYLLSSIEVLKSFPPAIL